MNVSQSLPFQALSNVCISRRFSSTPIPKIHLVDYRLRVGSTIMIILASLFLTILTNSLINRFHISCHLLLNRSHHSPLSMRLVIVKEVMWCWSCNKVMEHDVSNHPGSAGGWVTIVCKGCRATQVEQLWKDGTIRDSLRGQISNEQSP